MTGLDGLTPKEREILELISQGKTNSEIARDLKIAYKTVQSHAHRIYQKMNVENRTEAAMVVVNQRLNEAHVEIENLREKIAALQPEAQALKFYANKIADSVEKLVEKLGDNP